MADTVKSYDQISGEYYTYPSSGNKTVKVSNTISSITIVGKDNVGKMSDKLTKVQLGSNITNIGDYCCYAPTDVRSRLTSVVESNAKIIGDHAFQNCVNLTSYGRLNAGSGNNSPSVLYTVGNYAFANSGLKSVHLNLQHDGAITPDYNYQGCVLTEKEHGPYVGYYSFANCKSLKDVTFYKSTEIGSHMFDGCTSLSGVYFSKNNSSINSMNGSCVGEYSFANCTKLSSIEFPKKFEVIANNMFENCTSLREIKFNGTSADANGDHLIGINEYAFKNTPKLTELSIPASVTHIELFSPECLAGSSISAVYLNGMLSNEFNDFYTLSSRTTTKSITTSTTLTGQFKVGTMYQNKFDEVAAEAKKTHIPVVLWYCGKNCGNCINFKNKVASTDAFKDWVANTPYYFVHGDNHDPYGYGYKFWHSIKWDIKRQLFVMFGLLWYKSDGTTVARSLKTLVGESGDLDYIKSQCSQYFKGYEYNDMTLTSTKTVTTTEEFVVTNTDFNGWGVGHKCDFYTSDGMVFHYDPDLKLSATVDGISTKIKGDVVTVTFNIKGKDGANDTVKMTVASTTLLEDFAPNMYYLGAASRWDPATQKTETGRTNLCGPVYDYTMVKFNGWGVKDLTAGSTRTINANYKQPSGRTGITVVFYDNLNHYETQDVPPKGTAVPFPVTQEYIVPTTQDIEDLKDIDLVNDSLSAAMTNINALFSPTDGTEENPELPELLAWIEVAATYKGVPRVHAYKTTRNCVSKCRSDTVYEFVKIYIPWFSNYYSGEGTDAVIRKQSNGSVRIGKDKSLMNYIYYDKDTMSLGITQKVNGEQKLIAYYSLGQYFPCKLHKSTGKISVDNITTSKLLSKSLNDLYYGGR